MRVDRIVLVVGALVGLAAPAAWSQAGHHHRQASPNPDSAADTAFAALQARGRIAMGVDQYTSTHRFDALPDGGRIEFQAAAGDSVGVVQIRRHLQEVAAAFARGDFSVPGFVHAQSVPGTRVMADRRDRISYEFRELARGGEIRIRTDDPAALAAIHEFMVFQRQDHRAGGREH